MTAQPSTAGRRSLLISAVEAGRLAWRAAPGQLAGVTATTLVVGAVPIAAAWLTTAVLDRIVAPGPSGAVVGLAVGLACAGVIGAVLPQLGQYLEGEADRRIGLHAQDELFSAVERYTGLRRFEEPVFLDRLRLAQHSAQSPGQIVGTLFGLGRDTVTLVGFVVSLAVISLVFTAIVLASAIPALFIELRISRQRADMMLRIEPAERWQFFYSELLTTAEAAKEVRLFGLGAFLRGRMTNQLRSANSAHRALDRKDLAAQGALALLGALISEIVTSGPDLPEPAVPRALPPLRHGIELRDVWFRYSDEHPWVLRGVSLRIPCDRSVAFVGRNGAGKSTLVKLLCRFYDPTRGAILWDGVDIRDVPTTELRARIGAAFQDFVAYDFTAADNVAVGDLSALGDTARIEAAARQAGVHQVLAGLPTGYDTLLTRLFSATSLEDDPQAGVQLSGGQWQRVALARAFLRDDRDLMILDEPSAGLDAEAEHDIHTRLGRLRRGRTNVLITHRLGAVRDADLIVVLADGEIAEQGTHDALLAAGGVYARIFTLQAAGYAETPCPVELA